MDCPLVSIIIPLYNGERFIGRTLLSALAQTYKRIEIIVVDDGSTDQGPELAQSMAHNDDRIRVFRIQQSGVAVARNIAIDRSRGELIAPLDADDLWHPEKIARQVAIMESASPAVGLVYCLSIIIDENDFIVQIPTGQRTPAGEVIDQLATSNFLANASCPLIKRSFVEAVGGFDVNLRPHGAEDWKFYLELSALCQFAVVPEYLVGYRKSATSLSRNVSGMAQSAELVVRWMDEKWPNLPENLKTERTYSINAYLARKSLDNRRAFDALFYRTKSYIARPSSICGLSSVVFFIQVLRAIAHGFGLKWTAPQRGRTRISFQNFDGVQSLTGSHGYRTNPAVDRHVWR